MRIAILGATSQIAKDLVQSFAAQSRHELVLYARRPDAVLQWLSSVGLEGRYVAEDFTVFSTDEHFDAILNFVGVGNPAQAAAMGATIFDVTLKYDELALDYVRHHPACRYIFLSSGAAYGSSFDAPVDENTKAVIAINNLQPQDWYGVAKLYAECRHRSLSHMPIIDVRVFNYYSHTQDIKARFLITDILRAIKSGDTLITTPENIVRDYIGPNDFYKFVMLILATTPETNDVMDCYSKAPVDKMTLLSTMKKQFGLVYEVIEAPGGINEARAKMGYFSRNFKAKEYGYIPVMTSLEIVISETIKVFDV